MDGYDACRAGVPPNYYHCAILPKKFHQKPREVKDLEPVELFVGKTPPNPWGLYDMHGNVEEWCLDWYGPYVAGTQTDPIGYTDSEFRVTRGGSHSTLIYALRSANRQGALPESRNWLMGFRVVLGDPPKTKPLPVPPLELHQQNVVQRPRELISKGLDPDTPYFAGPKRFVNIPTEQQGPIYASHNHGPGIVECPNGDLLAVWFSCLSERNRDMSQAASRLRWGSDKWDQASLFFDAPDRNDPTPTVWFDDDKTIYYFIGISMAGNYKCMAIAMRKSTDSGATWTKARMVMPEYIPGHQASEPAFRMNDGAIALAVDGRQSLWISHDKGNTWTNPGGGTPGTHPGIVHLKDGRLLGFSRGGEINRMMTMSISSDMGKTYVHTASDFPPIDGGQRLVLLRLREGPILFASFADDGTEIIDSSGTRRSVRGLFTALSTDEGKTWPYKRLVTDDGPGRPVECSAGGLFIMSQRNAEFRGYLSVCQSLDGLVHLISSRQHYTFNLAWLKTPSRPLKYPPVALKAVKETFTGPDFDADGWAHYKSYTGGFNGKGQYTVKSTSRSNGINRIIGKGSFEMTAAFDNFSFHPGSRGGRTTPGIGVRVSDARRQGLEFRIEHNKLILGRKDSMKLSRPPKSAKVKFTWNQDNRRMRLCDGLDGAEATTEMPSSQKGIFPDHVLSETTSVYMLMDHGSVDIDEFEIITLSN